MGGRDELKQRYFFLPRSLDGYQGCFAVSGLLINSFITSSVPVMENCA